MAQTTQIILTDDLDGSEATQTLTFAWQGTSYEIDLTDEHASQLEAALVDWIAAARKVPARGSANGSMRSSAPRASSSSSSKRTDLDDVRAWARANGHSVSDRGRIAGKILDAYDAAH